MNDKYKQAIEARIRELETDNQKLVAQLNANTGAIGALQFALAAGQENVPSAVAIAKEAIDPGAAIAAFPTDAIKIEEIRPAKKPARIPPM